MPRRNFPPSPSRYNRLSPRRRWRWGKCLTGWLLPLRSWLGRFWQGRIFKFRAWRQRIPRRDKWLAVALLVAWLVLLGGKFFVPGLYVFEGNLLVEEMSFSYTGSAERLFLQNIGGLGSLDLQGRQPQPLTLRGNFSSNNPQLNAKLENIDKLTVKLPHANSRFLLGSDPSSSSLSLVELRLPFQTRVESLAYRDGALDLCLQSQEIDDNLCQLANVASMEAPKKDMPVGTFVFKPGSEPLQVRVASVALPQLGISADSQMARETSFQWVPAANATQLQATLLSPTQVYLQAPELSPGKDGTTSSEWVYGDLDVTNVRFTKTNRKSDVRDEIEMSSILQGKVRMRKKTMEVQKRQFLTVQKGPGIRKLRRVKVQPQGFRVLFSGKSTGLAVGLYRQFPVQNIEPKWLSKYLSQEAFSGIVGLLTAFTAILFPRLFPPPARNQNS